MEHVGYLSETTGEWAFRSHALDGSNRNESRYSLETVTGLPIDHGWAPHGTAAFAAVLPEMSTHDIWTWSSGADEPEVLLSGPEDQPDRAVPRQVSSAGGIESFWSRDGGKLWFRNGQGQLFEVEVDDDLPRLPMSWKWP